MEQLRLQFSVLLANWQQALTGGIILTSAIIVLMGILKKCALGKIKNKLLRKVVLAFSSVALVFPATALYFVADSINFSHYWVGCGLTALLTIVTYWLYENTGCRNLIDLIGARTLGKWFGAIRDALLNKKSNEELQNSLSMTTDELKEEIKKELKTHVKDDGDLNKL